MRLPLTLAILLVVNEGCTTVMPWERGNLAKPQMAMQPFASQVEFREHIYGSREASSGSTSGAGGGGCGCY